MNIRKLFFLFWSCMAIGAVVTAATGLLMIALDQEFRFMGLEGAGFNFAMMLLVGAMIGAFSQMGFFAYLMLNYIAMSMLRKHYLWQTLQAYTTVFGVFFLGYLLYSNGELQHPLLFWLLPLVLAVSSWAVAVIKVRQTNTKALVPTLFLLIVGTSIEAWPALGPENNTSAVIFMFVPLFACNVYQILMLHRVLKSGSDEAKVKEATEVA